MNGAVLITRVVPKTKSSTLSIRGSSRIPIPSRFPRPLPTACSLSRLRACRSFVPSTIVPLRDLDASREAGLSSAEIGAAGGNVATLDGAVCWKPIGQMKPYCGSRLRGSGGCFAVW